MTFTKQYNELADALVTQCVVLPNEDIHPNKKIAHYLTDSAVWDTGADTTIISSKIVKELSLQPCSVSKILGIGGFIDSNIYQIHLGLPSGEMIHNLEVMSMDDGISDYDVIIGMDVICECDLAITNPNSKTKFTFERPSKRDIDFTKE